MPANPPSPVHHPEGDSKKPTPLPARKILHPVFGAWCRTQSFSYLPGMGGHHHIYYEAYVDDPVKKTWSVNRVVDRSEERSKLIPGESGTLVYLVRSGMAFPDAIKALSEFENNCLKNSGAFSVLFPKAEHMEYRHFVSFTEREGYVFDTTGVPHARPAQGALPPGAGLSRTAVERAAQHNQRPADEYDDFSPSQKIPAIHFIFDVFNHAAKKQTFAEALIFVRVMNIMDKFTDCIDAAYQKLDEYTKAYESMGKGGLINDAERSLMIADSFLDQIKAYKIDTSPFKNFLLQSQACCQIIHAQGIYDLMQKGRGDFEQNETMFQTRLERLISLFSKIDNNSKNLGNLKDLIVQGQAPEAPKALKTFVDNYRSQRQRFSNQNHSAKPDQRSP